MNEVIHIEDYIGVFFQKVSLIVHKVYESQEVEGPAFAVGRGASAHVVDVAVELREKDVHVPAAVELWKKSFGDQLGDFGGVRKEACRYT